ncbi:raptor N-terminal caspase like domain-containing protein [Dipodascopsis tothii]|uniref:raptor N-terminal caspase like domain-containing protein n=1 Tax=Dipodascopsis tothii TaxID=44089 RepID=UPI0034CF2709
MTEVLTGSQPSSVHIDGMLTSHGYIVNQGGGRAGVSPIGAVNGMSGNGPLEIAYSSEPDAAASPGEPPLRDDPNDAAYRYHERQEFKHGFEEVYTSESLMRRLSDMYYNHFVDKRHETAGNPRPPEEAESRLPDWRTRDRQKTISAAIVLCLHLGIDPPDVVKTDPCAKLEAWIDPSEHTDSKKASEMIAKKLQTQYEQLSLRTRYKQIINPNVEDARRFCIGLRRAAKEERILFHYNGHGVPRPTASGEIWVFNRGYTQYIPVSVYDLQSWLGAPCLFVYDCHAAGNVVNNFNRFIEKRVNEERTRPAAAGATPAAAYRDCIQLAACQAHETLPMNPDLPADLFTCCLTTPIEIAVRWFVLQSPLPRDDVEMDVSIPGRLVDRRTPLGELNWIFTAITDTIAWSLLDSHLFKKLFRQDLMVAALFRNFLLAERIMRVHNCHPISEPKLPTTHNHPMWQAWDLAVDQCLSQIPLIKAAEAPGAPPYEYKHSTFFEEQLTAFENWLAKGIKNERPPEQLPVVLQVLLSQMHRLRALTLLSSFLDLGPWAVYLALSIGIFPYVLKLLQSPAAELKPLLVFIWARIICVDYQNIQQELLRDNGGSYFISILTTPPPEQARSKDYDHYAMCAFVISLFCRGNRVAQQACMAPEVLRACLGHMKMESTPLLRQWSCLCLSQLWEDNVPAKWMGVREQAPERLAAMLADPVPEVRTAALVALSTFLEAEETENRQEEYNKEMQARESQVAFAAIKLTTDGSVMVRKEVVVLFSRFVKHYSSKFMAIAFSQLEQDKIQKSGRPGDQPVVSIDFTNSSIFVGVWKSLLTLTTDPFMEVADMASDVADYVYLLLMKSPLAGPMQALIDAVATSPASPQAVKSTREPSADYHVNSAPAVRQPSSSILASTLRRSVSIATSIRNLALGYPEIVDEQVPEINRPPTDSGVSVSSVPYGHGIHPQTARCKKRRPQDTVALPLKSGFFDYSCEFFQEPQMSEPESETPGSVSLNQRKWRRTRNESILAVTQSQKDLALSSPWSAQLALLNNNTQPTKLVFAQYENHLVSVDDRDGVTIWDWQTKTKLNRFCNMNPPRTKITEAKLINEDDLPLLMTGAGDGVVRLYRHFEDPDKIELASAWRALSDMLPSNRSSGLVADWQQGRGSMLVGGDVKVIRVWDAARETCVVDIPARSGSPITSLTSDLVLNEIFIAGFGDGAVRVYDRRLDAREAMVRVWKYHPSWVLNVHMQRGGSRELISGSADGQINIWDLRFDQPIESVHTHERAMRAIDVHEHAPVFATGHQAVTIWDVNGQPKAVVRTSGYLQNRAQHVSALSFHPHRMLMAVNNSHDSQIHIYSCSASISHDIQPML